MTSLQTAYQIGVKLAMDEAGLSKVGGFPGGFRGEALNALGGGALGAGIGSLAADENNAARGAVVGGGTLAGTALGGSLGSRFGGAGLGLGMLAGGIAGNLGGRAIAPARRGPTGWVPAE